MSSSERFVLDKYLRPNRTFFYTIMIFVMAGLFAGLAWDVQLGLLSIIILDLVGLFLFLTIVVLLFRGKLAPNIAMLMVWITVLLMFYLSFIFLNIAGPNNDRVLIEMIKNIFMTAILGSLVGLVVDRRGALVFLATGLAFMLACLFFLQQSRTEIPKLILLSLILSGTLLIVFYYRYTLEGLLLNFGKTIVETARYKDRVEVNNEQNRPFVYFGHNSVGLIIDFREDVGRLTGLNKNLDREADGFTNAAILKEMSTYIKSLTHRIDLVTYLTSSNAQRKAEALDFGLLLEAVVYPFLIDPEYRSWLRIVYSIRARPLSWDTRYGWIRLFEYIFRSAIQKTAAASDSLSEYQIRLYLMQEDQNIELELRESRPILLPDVNKGGDEVETFFGPLRSLLSAMSARCELLLTTDTGSCVLRIAVPVKERLS